jgi:hypothetical protein
MIKPSHKWVAGAMLLAAVSAVGATAPCTSCAEPAKAEVKADAKVAAKNPQFEAVRSLIGTWVSTSPADAGKPITLVFKSTAGGTAVIESMFPGTEREMINLYAADEKGVVMTHYCMMGNQPRLRLTSIDDGVLKFDFVDGGNLKSRDEAHMDSLVITLKGNVMTQKWAMYQDGKFTGDHTFEFKRQ